MNKFLLLIALLIPLYSHAEQFVEVTTELQVDYFDNWQFFDKLGHYPGANHAPSLFKTQTRRCVVGSNTWMMDTSWDGGAITRWFTGSNFITRSMSLSSNWSSFDSEKTTGNNQRSLTNYTVTPRYVTTIHDSADGNPGRPGHVADLMFLDLGGKIAWLALCSAPCLKVPDHKLYPPDEYWKEDAVCFYGWKEQSEVFKDSLGLPKSINLVSTNNQSVLQYQVHQTTNFMGWNFPLEFFGVQYAESGTNGNAWHVDLAFKGRITGIKAASEPKIPPEVFESVRK